MGESRRTPIVVIVWVLAGCVVFVAGGLWMTQPRSSAEEWDTARDNEWEEETDDAELRTHDTFEDAWKQVWNTGASSQSVDDVGRTKSASPAAKTPSREPKEMPSTQLADPTAKDTVAQVSPLKERDDGKSRSPVTEGESKKSGDAGDALAAVIVPAELGLASGGPLTEGTRAAVAADLTTTGIAKPVATAASHADQELALSQPFLSPLEERVVTLRLAGSLGGKRLNPKDGYTWGRLAYFLQRERNPPYFLVFPSGALSGVMRPPATSGGRPVGRPVARRTVRGLPSLRPDGRLGSPLFVINLTAAVESGGAVRFYGRGLAQQYRCRVSAQVVYLGGEQPQVVDSFTVSETATAVQGRVATGPPGGAIYQAAIEKLIARLRATTYFR